jgi:tripartite-type tricarboxylate transporter receptor subunit TctC
MARSSMSRSSMSRSFISRSFISTSFMPALALAAISIVAGTLPCGAQGDFPNRVVKIVTPYVAASVPDILARALAPGLTAKLGQQFIIENRAGGSGTLGTASVARAEADGYTLLFAPALVLSVLPQARADAGYKPDSLVPVCQTFINTMGLVVRPDSPIKNIADLVAAAKQKPGGLNYGHPGVLTIPQLAVEEFLQAANIDIKDIPFRGGPQSITELLGGRIDAVSLVMGTEVGQNLKVIGVFGEQRVATFPDVPTVKEQGYDVAPVSFGGLFAPAATPAPVVRKLAQACADAANDGGYATIAKRAGQPDDYFADAAALQQRLARDIASKARVLARVKVQP